MQLLQSFDSYPICQAPFMHKQYNEWNASRPLLGYTVVHNVPLVSNTLTKIACLIAAGAKIIVTNPNFLEPHSSAIQSLDKDNIEFVDDITSLRGRKIDIYFDCGAELFQKLGAPTIGAIELTGSGHNYYKNAQVDFPVISIDPTYTKQLETVFGTADSISRAIEYLTGHTTKDKSWLVFGFGKIGRGIAFFCKQANLPITIVEINSQAREEAKKLDLAVVDPGNLNALKEALETAEIIITATGKENILGYYPKEWFQGKCLANMGVLDEFGPGFYEEEVLNKKLPINFVLNDPTSMVYIDPEFYAHNIAALQLLECRDTAGLITLAKQMDQEIIQDWCKFHNYTRDKIEKWFIQPELM